jgi:hypothetical protein
MKSKQLSDAVKQAAQKPVASNIINNGNQPDFLHLARKFTAADYLFSNPDIPQANTGGTYQYIDDVMYYQNPHTFEWSVAKSFNELQQKYALRISKNKDD